jgi:hypothetical protein
VLRVADIQRACEGLGCVAEKIARLRRYGRDCFAGLESEAKAGSF